MLHWEGIPLIFANILGEDFSVRGWKPNRRNTVRTLEGNLYLSCKTPLQMEMEIIVMQRDTLT
jgi:hypothetical protein